MSSHGIRPFVWMLCGCAWFSAMSLLSSRLGQERVPWQTIATVRSSVAFLLALLIAIVTGVKLVAVGPRALWLRSIAGSCSMLATFFALANLTASEVLTLTNTFPVWVAVLSWPMLGEKPSSGVWIAVCISVVGVALAVYPTDETARMFRLVPALAAVAAAFFTALAMLGLSRLKTLAPMAIVVHFSGVATVVCASGFLLFPVRQDGPKPFEIPEMTARLLAVGFTAMIGQIFLTLAFSRGTATKIAVVGLSQIVMVMVVEAAAGWRTFTPMNLFGTLLILGPTAWLMARARKPRTPPPEPVAIE
ncbi:DMT family transporter [Limnoglobus roseus]|uniref:EamA/RhaT family transporter n=1 Tax=Limnoglobus roseus TaxID=2598579 RepID=A0A5C1ADN8_9BACT|nr:DMT family transporter [Limnoglobus roseus]QEL17351.1 EamA/RhaT family transporter [Limnoglobus roseus]